MRFHVCFAALAATVVAASPAIAQQAPASALAKGTVLQSLTLVRQSDLDFGTVAPDKLNNPGRSRSTLTRIRVRPRGAAYPCRAGSAGRSSTGRERSVRRSRSRSDSRAAASCRTARNHPGGSGARQRQRRSDRHIPAGGVYTSMWAASSTSLQTSRAASTRRSSRYRDLSISCTSMRFGSGPARMLRGRFSFDRLAEFRLARRPAAAVGRTPGRRGEGRVLSVRNAVI